MPAFSRRVFYLVHKDFFPKAFSQGVTQGSIRNTHLFEGLIQSIKSKETFSDQDKEALADWCIKRLSKSQEAQTALDHELYELVEKATSNNNDPKNSWLDCLERIKFLLENGANPRFCFPDKKPLIEIVAEQNNIPLTYLLYAYGAYISEEKIQKESQAYQLIRDFEKYLGDDGQIFIPDLSLTDVRARRQVSTTLDYPQWFVDFDRLLADFAPGVSAKISSIFIDGLLLLSGVRTIAKEPFIFATSQNEIGIDTGLSETDLQKVLKFLNRHIKSKDDKARIPKGAQKPYLIIPQITEVIKKLLEYLKAIFSQNAERLTRYQRQTQALNAEKVVNYQTQLLFTRYQQNEWVSELQKILHPYKLHVAYFASILLKIFSGKFSTQLDCFKLVLSNDHADAILQFRGDEKAAEILVLNMNRIFPGVACVGSPIELKNKNFKLNSIHIDASAYLTLVLPYVNEHLEKIVTEDLKKTSIVAALDSAAEDIQEIVKTFPKKNLPQKEREIFRAAGYGLECKYRWLSSRMKEKKKPEQSEWLAYHEQKAKKYAWWFTEGVETNKGRAGAVHLHGQTGFFKSRLVNNSSSENAFALRFDEMRLASKDAKNLLGLTSLSK